MEVEGVIKEWGIWLSWGLGLKWLVNVVEGEMWSKRVVMVAEVVVLLFCHCCNC